MMNNEILKTHTKNIIGTRIHLGRIGVLINLPNQSYHMQYMKVIADMNTR